MTEQARAAYERLIVVLDRYIARQAAALPLPNGKTSQTCTRKPVGRALSAAKKTRRQTHRRSSKASIPALK